MEKSITSLQNPKVKETVQLQEKKGRDRAGSFLVEGIHLVEEARNHAEIEEIWIRDDRPYDLSFFEGPVYLVPQNVLNKISSQKSDARIIARIKKEEKEWDHPKKVLILDGLQDPGNVGTLIRSACAFGMDAIMMSPDCADIYSTKTIQASQGSVFQIPLYRMPLENGIAKLKEDGIPVFGAALSDHSVFLHDAEIPEIFGIIIGNEGNGIRQNILSLCDTIVKIEMATFESLNAAIAGSILLYEFYIRNVKNG